MSTALAKPVSLMVVSRSLDGGGAERFASVLLSSLDRSLIRPELVLLKDEIAYSLPEDVPIIKLGYRKLWHLPGAIRRLKKQIEQSQPDVLLSNIALTNIVTGLALGANSKTKWIARIGNSPKRISLSRRLGARMTYHRASQIVANSRGLAEEAKAFFPEQKNIIDVAENLTDFEGLDRLSKLEPEYWRDASKPLVLAAGRLSKQKRYDLMLKAFAQVREKVDASLWICGEGPEQKNIETQIRQLGLEENVKLLGFCRNLAALMDQADLFVMSSDHEGSPNALIEAQGLGLAAVSTRCPHGPDEIILPGETGTLVDSAESPEYSQTITDLLLDEERRCKMRLRAKEVTRRKFDHHIRCKHWEQLILQLAGT